MSQAPLPYESYSSARQRSRAMNAGAQADDYELTEAISASRVTLYAAICGHDPTTATTYVNDNIVPLRDTEGKG